MVFSSSIFLFAFLPICLLGYNLLDNRFRNIFLLILSLVFYGWGEPKFIFIMIVSIFINYLFGLGVDKFRRKKAIAYILITLMLAWNIVIFFIYKYLNFAITNINNFMGTEIPLTKFVLPIGISFFTFQAISYVIDVYRENGKVQKNPLNVALYITFFPQLIAGPIVRYETVANEINCRKVTINDFTLGLKRFIYGLSKKLIISNLAAVAADQIFDVVDYGALSTGAAWLGAICYTIQIFFDFSGYSDMAIGLGLMFGFHFNENFNYPYCSASVSEFWRRWHISLGTWFRDYVYFPLGGSRVKGKGRLIFNLFVVWMLTGVWHGASWNFVVWGFMYFVILTFEKLTGIPECFKTIWTKVLYRIITLLFVVFGWVIFRATNMHRAIDYIGVMFGVNGSGLSDNVFTQLVFDYLPVIILGVLFSIPFVPYIKGKIVEHYKKGEVICDTFSYVICILLFVVSSCFAVSSSYNPFIYFRF